MNYIKSILALFGGLLSFQAAADATDKTANQTLEDVKVTAKVQRSFSKSSDGDLRDAVNLGLLGKQNNCTSPITVVNYDEKAFANQAPRNVVDVIAKTDASTMNFGGETNTISGLYVRNLQIDARQFSVNGLSGLYSTYNSPTAGVASAQLIKGASTALVGMDAEGSAGASVNIETKRAGKQPINRFGVGYFSDSRYQTSADIGRRFGANGEWGIRVNGLIRQGDTAREHFSEKNREAAIGADYRGEQLKVGVDLMYSKRKTEGGRARVQDMQLLKFQMPEAPDGKINLIPQWSGQTTEDKTAMATFEYDTLKNVVVSGGLGYMDSRYDGSFTQLKMLNTQGNYRAEPSRAIDYLTRTTSANLKARGQFFSGSLEHQWNVAADYVKRHRDFDRSSKTFGGFSSNIYQPQFPATPTILSVNQQNTHETFTAPSLALSDTLMMFDNKFRLTLGTRLQYVRQENHQKQTKSTTHAISPMITAAYVPNNQLVVYGNYMRDLEPGALVDNDNAKNNGETLDPVKTNQMELGIRKNWQDGLITTTASVYRINRPSAYLDTQTKVFGYGGKEQNTGLELSTYANLLNKTLRPTFGITFQRAKLKNYQTNAGNMIDGNQQVTSPRVIAKAGVEWDTPFVSGLTLNAAAQYYGKSFQNAENTFRLPAYTTVDIGAKYALKLPKNQQVTLRGAVENVFNKNYWQIQRGRYDRSFAVVGMPRTVWLKVDYEF